MSGDDAYVYLLLLRNRFLEESGIYYASRKAQWFYGTCGFAGNPKLNDEFAAWCAKNGTDHAALCAKALKKESAEWVLERAARYCPPESSIPDGDDYEERRLAA